MVLSFHPLFVADKNILCAGRLPDPKDLSAICDARAVILSQGCRAALYEMARKNCQHVFPNFDCRFGYPGKIGQARLFEETNVRHPHTLVLENNNKLFRSDQNSGTPLPVPFVYKQNWGGEGSGVFLVDSESTWQAFKKKATFIEGTANSGGIIQAFIPCDNRSLRVAVIGETMHSYWRVQPDPGRFGNNLAQGGVIQRDLDPHLQEIGMAAVQRFCQKTGINLAGFDLLFSEDEMDTPRPRPYFLEINYFFGRRGLGGSDAFNAIFEAEARKWLKGLDLDLGLAQK